MKQQKKENNNILETLKKIKWEYFLNFLAMVFGVLLGFFLTNYKNDLSSEEDAKTEIEFMFRECEYNMANGYEIKDILNDTLATKKLYPKMSNNSSLVVLNNPYILKILDKDLYNLFMGYLQVCENINYIIPMYNQYLFSERYIPDREIKKVQNDLRHYIVYFLAYTKLTRSEITKHFGIKNQYTQQKKNYDKYIDSLKTLFLENKVNLYEH